jgi:NIMA (never in mitosis gene a)-related kinase
MENFQLCIVMDYAEGGDLFKVVDRARRKCQPIGEPKILRWMTQSFLAIKYLHDKHVLHRDLKSQNIFLSGSGRIKLGDFGISKVLENTECFAKTSIGTPYYLAPEICSQRPYSWAADIWALGCILFEMSMLRVPFDAQNFKQLCDRITRTSAPKISSNFSPELRDLCALMLSREPRKRPAAHDILQLPIIQGEIRKMLEEEKQKKASDVSKVAAEVEQPAPQAQENVPPPNIAPNLLGSPRKAVQAPAPRAVATPRSARIRESPRARNPSPAPMGKVARPQSGQRPGVPHYQQYSPRIRAPAARY